MGDVSNRCTERSSSWLPSTPTSSGLSSVSNGGGMLAHQEQISFSSANFVRSMNFGAQNGGEKMAVNGVCYHAPTVR
jgi:nuclear transcription factor Y, alpha